MRKTTRWWWFGLTLLVALLVPAAPALAQGPDGDVTVWNRDYLLAGGDTVGGDLLVVNGNATLETDSRVQGTAVVVNGNADVDGTIGKDLVVINGSINLGPQAWVKGDVVCSWNCTVERDEGARVDGSIISGMPSIPGIQVPRFDLTPDGGGWAPNLPGGRMWSGGSHWLLGGALRVLRGLFSVVVAAGLSVLLARIWSQQTARAGQAVLAAPWASLGAGLLAALVALVVMVALILTICLPPLVLLALVAAGLFGWASVGALVGERLLSALGARHYGASTQSMWLAFFGGLAGALMLGAPLAFIFGPLGPMVAGFAGAFLAVFLYELGLTRNTSDALRADWGTLVGRAAGIVLKLVIAIGMVIAVTLALVW